MGSRKLKRIINICISEAYKSPSEFKHGALCFSGNKVIASGYNKPSTLAKDKTKRVQLHAEASVIFNMDPKILRNSVLFVIRITNAGKLTMSRPCGKCIRLLKRRGLSSVAYSDKTGRVVRERI